MANNQIKTYSEMVDLQMAAEAFLRNIGSDIPTALLVDGNQNNSKFPTALASEFSSRYKLIAHQDLTLNSALTIPGVNDKSGLSASLFLETQTGQYTLSIRSTEFSSSIRDGGDILADIQEIPGRGWAFAQLNSLERFYQSLLDGSAANGGNGITIPNDAELSTFRANLNGMGKLNVTGYSLGANLAEAFTELHRDKVGQAYLFNGAGTGVPLGGRTFQYVWNKYQSVFDNPFSEYPTVGYGAYAGSPVASALDAYRQSPSATYATLYDNPKHALALYAIRDMVQGAFEISDALGTPSSAPRTADPQIVDIWASNYEGDSGTDTFTARTGMRHGSSQPIWYEDQ